MRRADFAFILCTFFSLQLWGQTNLILNPGFENLSAAFQGPVCSSGGYHSVNGGLGAPNPVSNTIDVGVINWEGTSVDLFNACRLNAMAIDPNFWTVPQNFFGVQAPQTGFGVNNTYIGMTPFQPENDEYGREYVSGMLSEPLIPGAEYEFTIYTSMADMNDIALSTFGVHFQDDLWGNSNPSASSPVTGLNLSPHIKLAPEGGTHYTVIQDSDNWVRLSGTFVATGTEDVFLFGMFDTTAVEGESWERINQNSDSRRAYYYFDNASLIVIASLGFVVNGTAEDDNPETSEIDHEFVCGEEIQTYVTLKVNANFHQWKLQEVDENYNPIGLEHTTPIVEASPYDINVKETFSDVAFTDDKHFKLTLRGSAEGNDWREVSQYLHIIYTAPITWEILPGVSAYILDDIRFVNTSENVAQTQWTFEGATEPFSNLDDTTTSWPVDGVYNVNIQVERENGCITQEQQRMTIINDHIFIPNSFTPNGDGRNDVFFPVGDFFTYRIRIFDRWGKILFDQENTPWDGKFQGRELPTGVYVYEITPRQQNTLTILTGDEPPRGRSKVGSVTLTR